MKHPKIPYCCFLLISTIVAIMSFAKIANASFLPLSPSLKNEVQECGQKIQDAIDKGIFSTGLAKKCPLSSRLMQWLRYTSDTSSVTFSEIITFLMQNPTWPSQEQMQERAEEALPAMPSKKEQQLARTWFKKNLPQTGHGWAYYGRLVQQPGQYLNEQIKKAWIEETFSPKGQAIFLQAFRKDLTPKDHFQRCERLLLKDKLDQVRSLLPELKPERRELIKARLQIAEKKDENFATILEKLPASQRKNPAVLYEQIRWHVARKDDEVAIAILSAFPGSHMPLYREALWKSRNLLSRRLIESKRYRDAYNVVRSHGLTRGEGFAVGEWLSGWIALRFLKNPQAAKTHFEMLHAHVSTPISKSRAAFWIGEAEAGLKQKSQAKFWYEKAASYPTTFYGQLALSRMNVPLKKLSFRGPTKTQKVLAHFKNRPETQVIQLLHALKRPDRMDPFFVTLAHVITDIQEGELLVEFAAAYRSTFAGVWIAVKSTKTSVPLANATYPTLKRPHLDKSIAPLVHAIIRQESRFGPKEVSQAGAKGMMQLLPTTAKEVEKKFRIPARDLFNLDHNVTIGTKYLEGLLEHYSGNLILAIAAYNCGPTPVNRWIEEIGGRPGEVGVDPIEWIESIPYAETRNYVQRVLEAYIVYRQRLGLEPLNLLKLLQDQTAKAAT